MALLAERRKKLEPGEVGLLAAPGAGRGDWRAAHRRRFSHANARAAGGF